MNKRIKDLRKSLGLTQQEFADKIGTSRANIANYECSKRIPSVAVVSLICRTFNINEEWLRTGKGKMKVFLAKEQEITEGERIRQVRTSQNLTLEKFGEKIGITKAAMSNIEKSKRSVTDQVRKAVCREFHINEEWLRTGEGEMQASPAREQDIPDIDTVFLRRQDDSFRYRLIKAICAMDEDEIRVLEKFIEELSEK